MAKKKAKKAKTAAQAKGKKVTKTAGKRKSAKASAKKNSSAEKKSSKNPAKKATGRSVSSAGGSRDIRTDHLIIGGGPAGYNAAETIRQYDQRAKITMVSDDPAHSRMVIPYYMARQIPEEHVYTGTEAYFKSKKIGTIFGKRVCYVDSENSAVVLTDATRIRYKNLLLATGSSPTKPPIAGIGLPGVYNCWTIRDAEAILKQLKKGKDVVFVGAGFIGFIVLNALAKIDCRLHVVESQSHVLPRMLDGEAARLVESWLHEKQIVVHTGATVDRIERDGQRLTAHLTTGVVLHGDAVVISTGIRPNVNFLEGSGVKTNAAVVVDDHLRTNVKNIYAAGDIAEGPDLLNGSKVVHAIQPTAVDHGRVAGANMAGKRVKYRGSLLLNILDVVGLQCASFGRWAEPDLEDKTVINETRPIYRRLVFDGDVLVGAALVGRTNDVSNLNDMGMIKGFIQTRTPLGQWKDYIVHNPLDIRRAYLATGIAQKLLNTTLLPQAADGRDYRFKDAPATTKRSKHHKTFMATFVQPTPPPSPPPVPAH